MTTVVITGTNRGIGLELARQYAEQGCEVIAACREPSAELSALDVDVCAGVEVATDAGARKLRQHIGDRTVDILINNAGMLRSDRYESIDFDAMEEQFLNTASVIPRLTLLPASFFWLPSSIHF